MLGRVGRWCHNHRVIVLVAWIVAVIGFGAASSAAGSDFAQQFKLPDVESERGFDILDARFAGKGGGQTGQIVFKAPAGVQTPAVKDPMSAFFATVDEIPGVDVTSPYAPNESRLLSDDGTIAYATIEIPDDIGFDAATKLGDQIQEKAPTIQGVQIEYGGDMFGEFEPPSSELLGLVVRHRHPDRRLRLGARHGPARSAWRSPASASASHDRDPRSATCCRCPTSPPRSAVMIGLGVGIDYALFIVTRYREGLHDGHVDRGRHGRSPSTPRAGPCCSPAPRWSSRCSACS